MTELFKKDRKGRTYLTESQLVGNQERYKQAIEMVINAIEDGHLDTVSLIDHDFIIDYSGKKAKIVGETHKVKNMDEIESDKKLHSKYLLESLKGIEAMLWNYYNSVLDQKHIKVAAAKTKAQKASLLEKEKKLAYKRQEQAWNTNQNQR